MSSFDESRAEAGRLLDEGMALVTHEVRTLYPMLAAYVHAHHQAAADFLSAFDEEREQVPFAVSNDVLMAASAHILAGAHWLETVTCDSRDDTVHYLDHTRYASHQSELAWGLSISPITWFRNRLQQERLRRN